MSSPVHVIGAGPAVSECALQLARRKMPVVFHAMRPGKGTPSRIEIRRSEVTNLAPPGVVERCPRVPSRKASSTWWVASSEV